MNSNDNMKKYGHVAGGASALLGLFSFVIAIVAPLVGLGDVLDYIGVDYKRNDLFDEIDGI